MYSIVVYKNIKLALFLIGGLLAFISTFAKSYFIDYEKKLLIATKINKLKDGYEITFTDKEKVNKYIYRTRKDIFVEEKEYLLDIYKGGLSIYEDEKSVDILYAVKRKREDNLNIFEKFILSKYKDKDFKEITY